jgi:hypothetical protein
MKFTRKLSGLPKSNWKISKKRELSKWRLLK